MRTATPKNSLRSECSENACELDEQEISLAALLGAEGFKITGTLNGVTLGTSQLKHFEGEILRYGGWLTDSAFAVHSGILTDGEPGTPEFFEERIIHAYSVGGPSGTNPGESATWKGALLAVNIDPTSPSVGTFVKGESTIKVDLSVSEVEVWLDGMRGHDPITWRGLLLVDGTFEETELLVPWRVEDPMRTSIQGTFYGEAHAEVGGIFVRNGLHGAFGANKE